MLLCSQTPSEYLLGGALSVFVYYLRSHHNWLLRELTGGWASVRIVQSHGMPNGVWLFKCLGVLRNGAPVTALMLDRYGNYVVQRMVEVAEGQQREQLFRRLLEQLPLLRSCTYGGSYPIASDCALMFNTLKRPIAAIMTSTCHPLP